MNKKGLLLAGIFALIFVPGTIPAFMVAKTAKLKKKFNAQKNIEG